MVFAVTGTGRVAQGILDVLELLPHQKIEPDDLKSHFESGNYDNKKVIISQFKAKDLVRKVTAEVDEPFDKKKTIMKILKITLASSMSIYHMLNS